jgi:hypothetical protein
VLDILLSIAHPTIVSHRDIVIPVAAKNGVIVTANNPAIQTGLAVLT